jgi:ubiquinone biosynthesis monooxygenase Coq7
MIGYVDRAIRVLTSGVVDSSRMSPAVNITDSLLTTEERQKSVALMRINHTGEVCAQALYQSQVMVAKNNATSQWMKEAADEEIDHLSWCEQRIQQLEGRTSVLNPLFYAGSFLMGAGVGLISDRISLGFIEATESQVSKHLTQHLDRLPVADKKSRVIVEQMLQDERAHAHTAIKKGAVVFPSWVKRAMTQVSALMTTLVYKW